MSAVSPTPRPGDRGTDLPNHHRRRLGWVAVEKVQMSAALLPRLSRDDFDTELNADIFETV